MPGASDSAIALTQTILSYWRAGDLHKSPRVDIQRQQSDGAGRPLMNHFIRRAIFLALALLGRSSRSGSRAYKGSPIESRRAIVIYGDRRNGLETALLLN
jgi:hypothetical protein